MYFQLVDNRVLSTQGQPDVSLHRLTMSEGSPSSARLYMCSSLLSRSSSSVYRRKLRHNQAVQVESTVMSFCHNHSLKQPGLCFQARVELAPPPSRTTHTGDTLYKYIGAFKPGSSLHLRSHLDGLGADAAGAASSEGARVEALFRFLCLKRGGG